MRKNKKSKPMSGEMKVPSVLERRFDQFIEVHNLKAPSIVIVDDLVYRVQGVEVSGNEMAGCFVTKDAKAIIDCGIAAQRFNVDLEENRPDTSRWWAPAWW